MDWTGYNAVVVSDTAGRITCQRCGERWLVRRCWIDRPSVQCCAVLIRHRQNCVLIHPAARACDLPGQDGK